MPERWRTKLSELPKLEDPEQIWMRARDREVPFGPDVPPSRQRVLAGVVALVIFVAAGAFAFRAFSASGTRIGSDPASEPPRTAEEQASDVLRIRCDGDRAEVLTPIVTAWPDGIHVIVDSPDGPAKLARSAQVPWTMWSLGGWVLEPGEVAVPLPVGRAFAWCDPGPQSWADRANEVPFTVVDDGTSGYVSYDLSCDPDDERWLEVSGWDIDAPTFGSAESAMSASFPLLPTDTVEHAGYLASEVGPPTYRVVREGQIVLWASLADPDEGYKVMGARACLGAELGTPRLHQDGIRYVG